MPKPGPTPPFHSPFFLSSSPHRYRLTGGVLGAWTNIRLPLYGCRNFHPRHTPLPVAYRGFPPNNGPVVQGRRQHIIIPNLLPTLQPCILPHHPSWTHPQTPRAGLHPLPHEYKQNTCELFLLLFFHLLFLVDLGSRPRCVRT
ncbi:hypothetical protein MAPG_06615 [Magnaporthiopsis poae ATCC 64411]|uniref:Uncharacterized protein n=1 Tax=Magnaporthiopsis poae (strain ATCC 64411 / 73-15) TaxID=644358 RepID=A0A0C4E2H9_MAGP6|nr:hypothetical protein MAPG_06615 [Magnaporthiopsis poae ATCC 64411]